MWLVGKVGVELVGGWFKVSMSNIFQICQIYLNMSNMSYIQIYFRFVFNGHVLSNYNWSTFLIGNF